MYGWAISPRLPVNNFEWIKETSQFNEDLRRNYHERSDEEYYFEADVEDPEKIYELHNDLQYLRERTKFKIVETKVIANLDDKIEFFTNIQNLKQALNHGLIWKTFIEWWNFFKKIG